MRKTALITGGSGAIGAACARKFHQEGYKILLHYNMGADKARRIADELSAHGDTVEIFGADFSIPSEVKKMCAEISAKHKKIDILVNAAGAGESGLFGDFSEEHIRQILEVNLVSAMMVSRAFIPAMVSAKSGNIINISSIWGISGASCETVYSTAKAGLIGFTKALAKELGPSGVRVNAIAPGVIDTPMNRALTAETIKDLVYMTPLNRLGTPDDIAEAALYLSGAGFVTGQVLTIDGGFL